MSDDPLHSNKKRDSILEAAVAAFREDGYELASMDRIAERANASKRTVYNYFPSKERLFEEVVQRLLSETLDLKRLNWNPEESVETQLSRYLKGKYLIMLNPTWSALLRVILSTYIRRPEMARYAVERACASEENVCAWMRAAHAAGRLRIEDPAMAASIFTAMSDGLLFWPLLFQEAPPEAERDRQVSEMIATFLSRHRP
jgi:TetR/AcrR family transcriptional regulator of autoinduction and epiphytic fitness